MPRSVGLPQVVHEPFLEKSRSGAQVYPGRAGGHVAGRGPEMRPVVASPAAYWVVPTRKAAPHGGYRHRGRRRTGSRDRWLLHAQVNERLTAEAGTLDPASYDRTHLDALRAAVCFRRTADGTFHGDFAGNGAVPWPRALDQVSPDVLPDLAQIRTPDSRWMPSTALRRSSEGRPPGRPADGRQSAQRCRGHCRQGLRRFCKAHAANSPSGCDNSVPITTVRRPHGPARVRTGHRPSAACAPVFPSLRPGRIRCYRHVAGPAHPRPVRSRKSRDAQLAQLS